MLGEDGTLTSLLVVTPPLDRGVRITTSVVVTLSTGRPRQVTTSVVVILSADGIQEDQFAGRDPEEELKQPLRPSRWS